MSRVVVVQHVAHEGPGLVAEFAAARGIALELVHAWRGDAIPPSTGDAPLLVLGGPMHAHDTAAHPHLAAEIRLLGDATRAGAPVLGICLGSQLLAIARGERVIRTGRFEVGFHPITIAPADDLLFAGVASGLAPLHWHEDAFALPAGAVALASSAMTRVQAFRAAPRAWGFLFHLEVTAADVAAWVAHEGAAELAPIAADAPARCAAIEPAARLVLGRWLDLVRA